MKLSKKHDPTKTATRVNQASAQMRRRIGEAQKACYDYVINMRMQRLTTNQYTFELYEGVLDDAAFDLSRLLEEKMIGDNWLATEYVEPSYTSGAARARSTLATQVNGVDKELLYLVSLPAYKLRTDLVRSRVFEGMKGLTNDMSKDLSRILGNAVMDGLNPKSVATEIAEAIGSSSSRAMTIARTEITTALRRGRLDEGDEVAVETGMKVMYMHISAFAPTSRPSHVARHGEIFSSEDCRYWWSIDYNAINCLCSTIEVFVDEFGNPISPGLLKKAADIKAKFEGNDNE